MDANSSTQMLNQIFGHQPNDDSSGNFFPSGNRNQYRELERFDTDAELQRWMGTQGKKWGIVQKGRVTIEDIIDQYACVFRRRKGYACRVQMRVRHNRRNGRKVVEVLDLDHDHTFYGCKMGSEYNNDSITSFPNHQQFGADFSGHLNGPSEFDDHPEGQNDMLFGGLIKQEQPNLDLSTLISVNSEEMEQHQQEGDEEGMMAPGDGTQPSMELLLNNLLNKYTDNNNAGGGENGDGEEHGGGAYGGGQEDGGVYGDEQEQHEGQIQQQQHDEALAERVAEKMTNYLTSQLEPKFASILSVLSSLTRSVDELKRTVQQQQLQQQQRRVQPKLMNSSPMTTMPNKSINHTPSTIGTSSTITVPTSSTDHQQQSKKIVPKISFRPFSVPQLRAQQQQQQVSQIGTTKYTAHNGGINGGTKNGGGVADTARTSGTTFRPLSPPVLSAQQRPNPNNNSFDSKPTKPFSSSIGSSSSICWAPMKPSLNLNSSAMNLTSSSSIKPKLATINSGVIVKQRKPRKSIFAYRQRRRELSYRHMKEIGLTLLINGLPKSIFHCRVGDIHNAVQAKRRELANQGQKVMYRGSDVTDQLYRVDCSRVLVNGRRCGQMIADSLWPRGFFQQRMLMPILSGVNHRTKRRTDGTMRAAVAEDQFQVFKDALVRLGGFLMDESDRSKWMETAREGVNQRGLDELANSKRAHFEFEGGPLFGDEETAGNPGGGANGEAGNGNWLEAMLQQMQPSATAFTGSVSELPEGFLANGKDEEGMNEEEEEDEDEMEEQMEDDEEEDG